MGLVVGTGGAEKCIGGVLPCSGSLWGHCASRLWGPWHCVYRESGRRALPHGAGAACPGGAGGRGFTLLSHSGVPLHLSMAPPARAPLPLPSGNA